MQDDARFDQARLMSQMLVDIAQRSKCDFATIVGDLGLPVHLARAIVMLDEPAPMRDLADRLACDRSYITSLADQLEERGLVERRPGDDRRIKLLELTASGRTTRDRISQAVAQRSLVLRRLSDDERALLFPLLTKLLDGDDATHVAGACHG